MKSRVDLWLQTQLEYARLREERERTRIRLDTDEVRAVVCENGALRISTKDKYIFIPKDEVIKLAQWAMENYCPSSPFPPPPGWWYR